FSKIAHIRKIADHLVLTQRTSGRSEANSRIDNASWRRGAARSRLCRNHRLSYASRFHRPTYEPVPSMLIKTAVRKPKISAGVPAKKLPETRSPAAKAPAKKSASPTKPAKPAKPSLGALPEWDLSALYAGIGAPEIKRDLARADANCNAFEERYKGKLAG